MITMPLWKRLMNMIQFLKTSYWLMIKEILDTYLVANFQSESIKDHIQDAEYWTALQLKTIGLDT